VTPGLTVVVVTHQNADLIGRCLAAIRAAVRRYDLRVVVVDNGSTDGTAAVGRRADPHARILALDRNDGFSRAVNEGLKIATTEYVALINSDCFPDAGAIDVLVDALNADPGAGLVTGRLRYKDGRHQPSAGQLPTLASELWLALGLHRLPVLNRFGVGVLYSESLYVRPRRVGWVSGAFCVARREIGPLPTFGFMYGEDVEWAAAARERGWTAWVIPAAGAVHLGGASVTRSQGSDFVEARRTEFLVRWFSRGHPLKVPAARAILALYGLTRLVGAAFIAPARPAAAARGFRRAALIIRLAIGRSRVRYDDPEAIA
jgi:GT2 family glycosyltransferase